MSKKINLTIEDLIKLRLEFDEVLRRTRICDGSITFTKTFQNSETTRAKLNISLLAWEKMTSLVREFDVEVAWHGLVRRVDGESNSYELYDVIVEPQKVTGATVTTEDAEYQPWLNGQPDEVFNDLRLRGHSHVNMSVSPSATDTKMWGEIVEQLDCDMFYIFMILNKRGEKTIRIYDMASDTYFETADIDLVIGGTEELSAFISNAKTLVKREQPKYGGYSGYNGYSGYSGYSGNTGGYSSGAGSSASAAASGSAALPPAKTEPAKQEEKEADSPPEKKPAAKKFGAGKKNRKGTPRKVVSIEKYYEDDDDYNIYD